MDSGGGSEITRLIMGWVDGSLDSPGQTRLIRLAAQIVLFRLRSRLAAAAGPAGHDHLQLALYAVTPLFSAGTGPDSALSKSWLSASPGNDPADVIAWLESRVVQAAKRELQRLIGESTPYEYRLRRRILRAMHEHPQLLLFPKRRPEFVCLRTQTMLGEHLPPVTSSDVREAISSTASSGMGLKELLGAVVTFLFQRPGGCNAIPLWTLYEGIAERDRAMALSEFETATGVRPTEANLAVAVAVKEAADRATQSIDPILQRHVRLGKITGSQAGRIRAGITIYLGHFARDGSDVQLMSCLQESWPRLMADQYKSKYAKMFEYLVSVARTQFIEYWKQ